MAQGQIVFWDDLRTPKKMSVREKIAAYGAERVNIDEMVSLLLGIEPQKLDEILQGEELHRLITLSLPDLEKRTSKVLAAKIFALGEVIKKQRLIMAAPKPIINSPADIASLLIEEMRYLTQEEVRVVLLNTKNHVLKVHTSTIGTLNSSLITPREVFRAAIQNNANAIILVHNHPSGLPDPSKEDIEVTKRLIEVGKTVGIEVLDHVIIGDNRYVSLKEKGVI